MPGDPVGSEGEGGTPEPVQPHEKLSTLIYIRGVRRIPTGFPMGEGSGGWLPLRRCGLGPSRPIGCLSAVWVSPFVVRPTQPGTGATHSTPFQSPFHDRSSDSTNDGEVTLPGVVRE